MSRAYLLRHGSHGLIGRVLAGRMPDVLLSDQGRAEAERVARHFKRLEIARILSSPLERCQGTATPIASDRGLPVSITPALNEIDCGEWTGRGFADLADDPRWQAWNTDREQNGIPGGEDVHAVQRRVMSLLRQLATQDDGPAILVSHSDVIKVAVLTLLDAPLRWHDRLVVDPASVTTLDLWPGGGKIVRLNEAVS